MGRLHAEEFAESVKEGNISLEAALEYHLTGNHYPPVHRSFIPVAIKAIELGNNDDWDKEIKMPNGKTLTAAKIIEGLHLESFLEEREI
jgi:hypothetical protein